MIYPDRPPVKQFVLSPPNRVRSARGGGFGRPLSGWQRQASACRWFCECDGPSASSEDSACRCHPESTAAVRLLTRRLRRPSRGRCHRIPAAPVPPGPRPRDALTCRGRTSNWNAGMIEYWNNGGVRRPELALFCAQVSPNWVCFARLAPRPPPLVPRRTRFCRELGLFVQHALVPQAPTRPALPGPDWVCSARFAPPRARPTGEIGFVLHDSLRPIGFVSHV